MESKCPAALGSGGLWSNILVDEDSWEKIQVRLAAFGDGNSKAMGSGSFWVRISGSDDTAWTRITDRLTALNQQEIPETVYHPNSFWTTIADSEDAVWTDRIVPRVLQVLPLAPAALAKSSCWTKMSNSEDPDWTKVMSAVEDQQIGRTVKGINKFWNTWAVSIDWHALKTQNEQGKTINERMVKKFEENAADT